MVLLLYFYYSKLQYYFQYYSFTAVYFSRFLPGFAMSALLEDTDYNIRIAKARSSYLLNRTR